MWSDRLVTTPYCSGLSLLQGVLQSHVARVGKVTTPYCSGLSLLPTGKGSAAQTLGQVTTPYCSGLSLLLKRPKAQRLELARNHPLLFGTVSPTRVITIST